MEFRDYYHVLGVERTATADQIKSAWRRLARKYHPDVSKEPDAEKRFKDMQEAYEVLRDPEKRAAYDQLGSQWKSGEQFRPPPDWGSGFEFGGGRGGPGGPGGGRRRRAEQPANGPSEDGDFSDFFGSLFGGGSPFAQRRRARRARPSRAHRYRPCRGVSRHDHTLELKRPELKPDGTLEVRTHTVRVTIPAGVTEGQLIRLAGQGEGAPEGGSAGDLYLETHILPDPLYQLDGRDVTLTLPVAPWEAALGARVTVPTLGGAVDMRIAPGAQSGQKLRLRGRGLPGQPPGDQYVQLKVVLPPASTPEAKSLYEQMRGSLDFDPRAQLRRD